LKLIREIDQLPSKEFKKPVKTNDIGEARIEHLPLYWLLSWSRVDRADQLLPKEKPENSFKGD